MSSPELPMEWASTLRAHLPTRVLRVLPWASSINSKKSWTLKRQCYWHSGRVRLKPNTRIRLPVWFSICFASSPRLILIYLRPWATLSSSAVGMQRCWSFINVQACLLLKHGQPQMFLVQSWSLTTTSPRGWRPKLLQTLFQALKNLAQNSIFTLNNPTSMPAPSSMSLRVLLQTLTPSWGATVSWLVGRQAMTSKKLQSPDTHWPLATLRQSTAPLSLRRVAWVFSPPHTTTRLTRKPRQALKQLGIRKVATMLAWKWQANIVSTLRPLPRYEPLNPLLLRNDLAELSN